MSFRETHSEDSQVSQRNRLRISTQVGLTLILEVLYSGHKSALSLAIYFHKRSSRMHRLRPIQRLLVRRNLLKEARATFRNGDWPVYTGRRHCEVVPLPLHADVVKCSNKLEISGRASSTKLTKPKSFGEPQHRTAN